MTAAEIFAVMDKVPMEAWPEGMNYEEALPSVDLPSIWCINGHVIPDHHAELLFEAAMVRWLGKRNWLNGWNWISEGPHDTESGGWRVSLGAGPNHEAPTLLAALAAACVQIGADHAA